MTERNVPIGERNGSMTERNMPLNERNIATIERNMAMSETKGTTTERNMPLTERNGATSERNAANMGFCVKFMLFFEILGFLSHIVPSAPGAGRLHTAPAVISFTIHH